MYASLRHLMSSQIQRRNIHSWNGPVVGQSFRRELFSWVIINNTMLISFIESFYSCFDAGERCAAEKAA